jgi:hypothetical protein
MIDLIGDGEHGEPRLMFSDGAREIVGSSIEHKGRIYEPAAIDSSILRQLVLPTRCCPHGSTRQLLTEICKLMTNLVGLDEASSPLIGRIVLCSAIVDAISVAPALVIVGADTARANRLMALLSCLCRHSLSLTAVTPAGFCSLASGARFTYLISQAVVSDKLQKLLDDASCRDQRIPFRGRLLDLFGVQVLYTKSVLARDSWPLRSIQVSTIPTNKELPPFDQDLRQQITSEYQAKLLSFRRANLGAAIRIQFDSSKFDFPLRDLARSLAAATPDNDDLQSEIFELLSGDDLDSRASRWVDPSVVAIETVLVACHESLGETVYISELARIAQALLVGRNAEATVDPGLFGKRLKLLGFATEPRDAKGSKLLLSEAVRSRAQQLALDLGIAESSHDEVMKSETRG